MALKDVGNKVPIYKLKTTDEVMKYYDEWGEKDKYNKDMVEWNYTGPQETVDVFRRYTENKEMLKNSEYIALFPNVMIGLHIDHFYVFWLEPLTMNKTKEHMQMYYVGNESANGEDLKELRKENSRFWKDVMLEDIDAIEGMQEGRSSPVYNGGNFSPIMDQPTHQFHKWVANSLME